MKSTKGAAFEVCTWVMDHTGPVFFCVVVGTLVSLVLVGILSLAGLYTWQEWLGHSSAFGIGCGIGYSMARLISRCMDLIYYAWENGR